MTTTKGKTTDNRRAGSRLGQAHKDAGAVPEDSDRYLSLQDLVAYSGLCVRTLRKALADPLRPLPHYRRGGGKVLVRKSEFDRWMVQFRHEGRDLDRLVAEALKEVHP